MNIRVLKRAMALITVLIFVSISGTWAQEGIVSLNKASVEELVAIEDLEIDEELAKAIVAYREKNGPFKKPADLKKVPGMDDDWFEEINPTVNNGDIVYNPEEEASMKAY